MLLPVLWGSMAFVLALGVALFFFGWIGRPLDSHPLCGRCRFDLVGTPMLIGSACPECGAAIGSDRDVRRGNRKRRRWAMVAGSLTVVFVLLAGVPLVVVPVLGNAANMPTWTLLVEAEFGTDRLKSAAVDETLNRQTAGTLTPEQQRKLVTLAAEVQRNPNMQWTRAWAECLNTDLFYALLPPGEQDAVAVAGIEPSLKVRPRIRSGKGVLVPIGIAISGNERV